MKNTQGAWVLPAAMLLFAATAFAGSWTAVGRPAGEATETSVDSPLRLTPKTFAYRELAPRWETGLEMELRQGVVYELVIRCRALNSGSEGSTTLQAIVGRSLPKGDLIPLFRCGPALSDQFETFTAPFIVKENVSALSMLPV